METQKRGFTKTNLKTLIRWNGFWNELPWLLLFFFLFMSAQWYKRDVALCHEFLKDPCQSCIAANTMGENWADTWELKNKQIEDILANLSNGTTT